MKQTLTIPLTRWLRSPHTCWFRSPDRTPLSGCLRTPRLGPIFLFLLLLTGTYTSSSAQSKGQALIDSLLMQLPASREDTHRVNLLNKIAYHYPYINPEMGLKYGQQGLELAEKLNWSQGIAGACASIGANYANKAEYAKALDFEYRALKIYEDLNDVAGQAGMLRNIGIVLHTSKNQQKALEYDFKALEKFRQLKDSIGMATMYGNIANVYYSLKDKAKVEEYNLKSLNLCTQLGDKKGIARVLGNMANFYAVEGEFSKAMVYYFDALRREKALGNKNGVTRNMGNIGETYLDIARAAPGTVKPDSLIPAGKTANLHKALYYLEATIASAKTLQQTEYFMAFAEVLSDAYRLSGSNEAALGIYQEYIAVRDSVYDMEKMHDAARKEMEYEFGKREDSLAFQQQLAEVKLAEEQKLRNQEKMFYAISLLLVLISSAFMYNRWRVTQKQKKIIELEKQRSEDLLHNILPEEVAEELKAKGKAEAKLFDEVTVMFTDFKDFTRISEQLSPAELVAEVDYCFQAFDQIIHKYNIEKIKTIGDAYMCVGGLPVSNTTHAVDVVMAALEIQQFMREFIAQRKKEGRAAFELRIGCHTGPVVAGIVGVKKFAYDIWGDTVNTAARLESGSEPGKVNISETTHALVKDQFDSTYRGKIEAKGKGEIDMFFVEGLKVT